MNRQELFKNWEKPQWDEYYMAQAFQIAMRSMDPSTKQGCIVVGPNHEPLSLGYNSPPRGCIDAEIPLTRPEKYPFFIHSERNAINNAARRGISLQDSTFYITGHPCTGCFRDIIQVGARRIVYGPVMADCVKPEDIAAIEKMLKGRDNFSFEKFVGDRNRVLKLIQMAYDYFELESLPRTT